MYRKTSQKNYSEYNGEKIFLRDSTVPLFCKIMVLAVVVDPFDTNYEFFFAKYKSTYLFEFLSSRELENICCRGNAKV